MPTEQTDTTQTPPEEITYTPTVWADGADGGTPINAANLNNMEEAIMALVERTTKQVVTSMIADGAVTNAKLDQTLRDSLSQANYYASSNDAAKDLNDHLAGVVVYNATTLNAPDGLPYGLCICFANVPAAMVTDYRWAVQIALPTTGYPVFRRKVNEGEWTSWLPMSRPAA